MHALLLVILYLTATVSLAQKPVEDTWSNVPQSIDDRYTNPKHALYAGPNGWWNYGELRAEGTSDKTLKFAYKGGFNETMGIFVLVDTQKLQTFHLDFGTPEPAPGLYTIDQKGNFSQKKVAVSFSDVANQKIKEWSGTNGSGTIRVTIANGFLYFKCRQIILQPTGMHNEEKMKQPLKVGVEGAVKL